MANFYASVTESNGVLTPALQRGGTAPSGGTAKTIANYENIDGNYGITTRDYKIALQAILRAIVDDLSVNGA